MIRVTLQMGRFVRPVPRVLAQFLKALTIRLPIAREKMTLNLVTALLVHQLHRQHRVATRQGNNGVSVLQKTELPNLV